MISAVKATVSILITLLAISIGVSIIVSSNAQHKQSELSIKYKEKQKSLDSLEQVNYLSEMNLIRERETTDSLRVVLKEKETKLEQITIKYEKIRKNISSFTVDQHIEFFANELSTYFNTEQ